MWFMVSTLLYFLHMRYVIHYLKRHIYRNPVFVYQFAYIINMDNATLDIWLYLFELVLFNNCCLSNAEELDWR